MGMSLVIPVYASKREGRPGAGSAVIGVRDKQCIDHGRSRYSVRDFPQKLFLIQARCSSFRGLSVHAVVPSVRISLITSSGVKFVGWSDMDESLGSSLPAVVVDQRHPKTKVADGRRSVALDLKNHRRNNSTIAGRAADSDIERPRHEEDLVNRLPLQPFLNDGTTQPEAAIKN
jgi:hypothetical protein